MIFLQTAVVRTRELWYSVSPCERARVRQHLIVGAWLSLARAPGSGPGGRWFKSTRPDHFQTPPFIGLNYLLIFSCACVLWTNVDQFKTQADAFSPFLAERYVIF